MKANHITRRQMNAMTLTAAAAALNPFRRLWAAEADAMQTPADDPSVFVTDVVYKRENKPGFGVIHRGDLEDDLSLLDYYEKQPRASHAFFRAAREALDQAPMSKIADHPVIAETAEKLGFTHLGGPMLGAVGGDGVRVWLRTLRPASVTVEVEIDGAKRSFGPVDSTVESDLTALVEITGLEPDRRYPYRVWADGKPIAMPQDAAIRTAPTPGKPAKVRIVFGSCFHKSGLQNPKLLRRMLERNPTAALFYGDIAVDDRDNKVGLHRSDYLLRDLSPAWRAFAASVPVYATWDDHDYFNNDKQGIPSGFTDEDRRHVRQVWTQNWNNPYYGFGDEGGGIFLQTQIGPANLIMVDNRYFRFVNTQFNDPDRFLGAEQTQWLKERISESQTPFMLLTCGTMWSDYVSNGKDSWGRADAQNRDEIFKLVANKKVTRPLFLSGDRHGARGFRIPGPSGRTLYEFNSSLLGAHHGPPPWMENCPEQLFGFERLHAFSELELDDTGPQPVATYRLIHQDGDEMVRIVLPAS